MERYRNSRIKVPDFNWHLLNEIEIFLKSDIGATVDTEYPDYVFSDIAYKPIAYQPLGTKNLTMLDLGLIPFPIIFWDKEYLLKAIYSEITPALLLTFVSPLITIFTQEALEHWFCSILDIDILKNVDFEKRHKEIREEHSDYSNEKLSSVLWEKQIQENQFQLSLFIKSLGSKSKYSKYYKEVPTRPYSGKPVGIPERVFEYSKKIMYYSGNPPTLQSGELQDEERRIHLET